MVSWKGVIVGSHQDLLELCVSMSISFLEIEKQGHLESSDIEVTEHLGDVRVVKCGHHLWVSDDGAIHDEVWHKFAD